RCRRRRGHAGGAAAHPAGPGGGGRAGGRSARDRGRCTHGARRRPRPGIEPAGAGRVHRHPRERRRMKLSELCVRRPIATILLWACAVAAGVYGWATLPVSALPRYETPTIEVKARLSGASPATMASSVAAPLEKEF